MVPFILHSRNPIERPPGPGVSLPGRRLAAFRRDPTGFLTDLARTYGDFVHFRVGRRSFYLLSHPDFVQQVLVTDHEQVVKGRALQRMRAVLGDGLLTSEGEAHQIHRRLIQPAFHQKQIARYAQTMVEETGRTLSTWEDGSVVDVASEMNRLTLRIVGRTLFGRDLGAETAAIAAALDDLFVLTDPLWLALSRWMEWLPLPAARRYRQARNVFNQIVGRIIADHRQTWRPGNEPGDLIDLLLASQDEEGMGLDDETIRDHVLTLLLAGHETTANALAWTWWLLAQHPQVEAQLHAEVDRVLSGGRLPTLADVGALTYTRKVLSESMRLYPPAWIVGRETVGDYELGGYAIPAGATLLMSQWVVHRDPRYYPAPEVFDPERWTPERRNSRPRYAYFPFGGGPRVCIGAQFAWTEGVLLLATVARHWRLRALSTQQVTPDPRVTLRPRGGLSMRLQARS